MSTRWNSKFVFAGVLLVTLGNALGVLAEGLPPPPPPSPHLVPAAGAILVIGGLVGYGIHRLRKRK